MNQHVGRMHYQDSIRCDGDKTRACAFENAVTVKKIKFFESLLFKNKKNNEKSCCHSKKLGYPYF